jgi:hypothetical protein
LQTKGVELIASAFFLYNLKKPETFYFNCRQSVEPRANREKRSGEEAARKATNRRGTGE